MPREMTVDRPWTRGPMEPPERWSPPNALHCLCGDPEGTLRSPDCRICVPERYAGRAIEWPGADAPNHLYRRLMLRCRCSRTRWSWLMTDVRDLPEEVRIDHMGDREFICDACRGAWFRAGVLTEAEWRALYGAPEPVVLGAVRVMHRRGRRPRLPEAVRPELPSLPMSEVKELRRPMFRYLRDQGRTEPKYADLPLPPGMSRDVPTPPLDDGGGS